MLIYDASERMKNSPNTRDMEAYLKGVYDSAEFKEEDHPRGKEGSGKGGQFVKSEKTKQKEDDVDKIEDSKENKIEELSKKAMSVDADDFGLFMDELSHEQLVELRDALCDMNRRYNGADIVGQGGWKGTNFTRMDRKVRIDAIEGKLRADRKKEEEKERIKRRNEQLKKGFNDAARIAAINYRMFGDEPDGDEDFEGAIPEEMDEEDILYPMTPAVAKHINSFIGSLHGDPPDEWIEAAVSELPADTISYLADFYNDEGTTSIVHKCLRTRKVSEAVLHNLTESVLDNENVSDGKDLLKYGENLSGEDREAIEEMIKQVEK